MTRTIFPYTASDVSALARALNRELEAADRKLGHVAVAEPAGALRRLSELSAFSRAVFDAGPARRPACAARSGRSPADRTGGAALRCEPARCIRWPSKANHQMLVPVGAVGADSERHDLGRKADQRGAARPSPVRRLRAAAPALCDHGLMSRTAGRPRLSADRAAAAGGSAGADPPSRRCAGRASLTVHQGF